MSHHRPTYNLKIPPFGCLLLLIILMAWPCLVVWYFGVPSLLLTAFGLATGLLFYCSLPTRQQLRYFKGQQWWFWVLRAVVLGLLCLGAWASLIYLNYYATPPA